MNSPAVAFRAAQLAAIQGSADLAAAMDGKVHVFRRVPTGQKPDYVVVGEDQVLAEETECGTEGEIFATVHVWTRDADQAAALGKILIALLAVQLSLDGHVVDDWGLQNESYSTDPDGSTHGVLVFHYLTTEAVSV